jgi:hydroxymethylglutaryl-CoA lyase
MGIRTVDTSCGGLGGCPYAPGASGNISTEEVVYMLENSKFETGINLQKLIHASKFIYEELACPNRSKISQILLNKKTILN